MNGMKLTSRDLAQQRTRETLIKTAARLVAEQGFGGVSIGDITGAAGFTKGAFYSNFESREAMLLELLGQVHLQQRAAMSELETHSAPSLTSALDRLAEVAMLHTTSPTASLLIGEVQLLGRRNAEFAGRIRAGFEEQVRVFGGWIEGVLKSVGHRPALSSPELARVTLGLLQGLSQQPADRGAGLKRVIRQVLGRLFEEK